MNKADLSKHDADIIQKLEDQGENLMAIEYDFYMGVSHNDLNSVKNAIELLGVDFDNSYAIKQSSRLGNIKIVEYLIEKGARNGVEEMLDKIQNKDTYIGKPEKLPTIIKILSKKALQIRLEKNLPHSQNKPQKTKL